MAIVNFATATSAVVGAIAGAVGLFTAFYLFPDQALKRFNAQISMEKLKPRFDVHYYRVEARDVFYHVIYSRDLGDEKPVHPLLNSKEVGRSGNKGIFVDYYPEDTSKFYEGVGLPTVGANGEPADHQCAYWFFQFNYQGGYDIDDVKVAFAVDSSESNVAEGFYFLNADNNYEEGPSSKIVELGKVSAGEGFMLPIALECGREMEDGDIRVFTLKRYAIPLSIYYLDPILDKAGNAPVRKLLKNSVIDSSGIEGRG